MNLERAFVYSDAHHNKKSDRDKILDSIINQFVCENYAIISLGDNGRYPFFYDISLKGNHDKKGAKHLDITVPKIGEIYLSHGDEYEKRNIFLKISDKLFSGHLTEASKINSKVVDNVRSKQVKIGKFIVCGHYHYNLEGELFRVLGQFSTNNDVFSYLTIDEKGACIHSQSFSRCLYNF